VIEFVAYPKNSIIEILGNHSEFTYFLGIVNMFSDAGAGVIVVDVHYAYGFDFVRKTGDVEFLISFLKGNHFFSYNQVR